MFERAAEIQRRIQQKTLEGGRERYIRGELLRGLVTWIAWTGLMFVFKAFLFSWHEVVWVTITVFPLWMLGAYLHGRWKWNDLIKKQ